MFKPLVNSAQLANYFVKIADGQNRFFHCSGYFILIFMLTTV